MSSTSNHIFGNFELPQCFDSKTLKRGRLGCEGELLPRKLYEFSDGHICTDKTCEMHGKTKWAISLTYGVRAGMVAGIFIARLPEMNNCMDFTFHENGLLRSYTNYHAIGFTRLTVTDGGSTVTYAKDDLQVVLKGCKFARSTTVLSNEELVALARQRDAPAVEHLVPDLPHALHANGVLVSFDPDTPADLQLIVEHEGAYCDSTYTSCAAGV